MICTDNISCAVKDFYGVKCIFVKNAFEPVEVFYIKKILTINIKFDIFVI